MAGPRVGPFTIKDDLGNTLAVDVPREDLKVGITYTVVDAATTIVIASTGKIDLEKKFSISSFPSISAHSTLFKSIDPGDEPPYPVPEPVTPRACLWTHLKNPLIYNSFYGITEPYIIEHPFSYKNEDEILRSVQSYTKVYKYVDTGDGVLSDFSKYETDDIWFNKAVLYNGQQSTGILNLVPNPTNNLKLKMSYPILNTDSKSILFSKADNFYQYNTFWSVTKDVKKTHFIRTCESLSIDKEVNQNNMDYSIKSHKKATLRAKALKVRHILDDRSDVNLVSQFILTPTQKSE